MLKQVSKTQISIVTILLLVLSIVAVRMVVGEPSSPQNTNYSKSKGNPEAPLKIIKFSDYQCPSCARATDMIREYMQKYPNQIHVEMKYFPLKMHTFGLLAALYAECSRKQNKFWGMSDLLFSSQDVWRELDNAKPIFDRLATEIGVDQAVFDTCLVDTETPKLIWADRREGDALKVRSTPSFLVNDEFVVGGKALKRKLEEYFKEN
ncbi:MAG: protein-disulfide isomerase [Candidatus Omnitrophota bacterium]|jgi:protein-disulfide isomerase